VQRRKRGSEIQAGTRKELKKSSEDKSDERMEDKRAERIKP
jgi:hypothetical protein